MGIGYYFPGRFDCRKRINPSVAIHGVGKGIAFYSATDFFTVQRRSRQLKEAFQLEYFAPQPGVGGDHQGYRAGNVGPRHAGSTKIGIPAPRDGRADVDSGRYHIGFMEQGAVVVHWTAGTEPRDGVIALGGAYVERCREAGGRVVDGFATRARITGRHGDKNTGGAEILNRFLQEWDV